MDERVTAVVIAAACGLSCGMFVACTSSSLTYRTVHAGASDGVHVQVVPVSDELGVARRLAPDTASPRSATDALLEVGSWRVEATSSTLDVVAIRRRDPKVDALDGGIFVIAPGGSCALNGLADRVTGVLRDAGTELGFDVTVATADDPRLNAAADAFTKALVDPDAPEAQSGFHEPVDAWRDALARDFVANGSGRGDDEAATAAAYDLAIAHRLGDAEQMALVYAAIAVLRAPTHAAELDILRNVRATPPGRYPALRLEALKIRQGCGGVPDADKTGAMTTRRRALARNVYAARFVNYFGAARALEAAARLALTSTDPKAPTRAAAVLFFEAAAHLYARMPGPSVGSVPPDDVGCAAGLGSARENAARCLDIVSSLRAARNEGCP